MSQRREGDMETLLPETVLLRGLYRRRYYTGDPNVQPIRGELLEEEGRLGEGRSRCLMQTLWGPVLAL